MIYEYQILVTNYSINRVVMIGVSTSDLNQASALSYMNLNHITETLGELNAVIAGELDYLNWGTDLFYVSSDTPRSRGFVTRSRRYISATIARICNPCPQSNSFKPINKK